MATLKLIEFTDAMGNTCSIQESSATEDHIWLGIDYVESLSYAWEVRARMHLNKEQVAALLPLLQRFVETGKLSPS